MLYLILKLITFFKMYLIIHISRNSTKNWDIFSHIHLLNLIKQMRLGSGRMNRRTQVVLPLSRCRMKLLSYLGESLFSRYFKVIMPNIHGLLFLFTINSDIWIWALMRTPTFVNKMEPLCFWQSQKTRKDTT